MKYLIYLAFIFTVTGCRSNQDFLGKKTALWGTYTGKTKASHVTEYHSLKIIDDSCFYYKIGYDNQLLSECKGSYYVHSDSLLLVCDTLEGIHQYTNGYIGGAKFRFYIKKDKVLIGNQIKLTNRE